MKPWGGPGRHGQSLGPCSDDVRTEPLSGAYACLGVPGQTAKENGKKCFSILSDNNPCELAPLGFGPTKQAIFLGQINLLFSRG